MIAPVTEPDGEKCGFIKNVPKVDVAAQSEATASAREEQVRKWKLS